MDRASVFPHGRNLNLLILTVVGASATASLLVGGLIFILAKRSRSAKKINKLQLSDDDAEDRVKVQEEYKVSSNLNEMPGSSVCHLKLHGAPLNFRSFRRV